MSTLLLIKSSLFPDGGQSGRLADRFVAGWHRAHPDGRVVLRDLGSEPVPHLDAARVGAFMARPGGRTAEQQAVVDYSDALIAELQQADIVVLGVPMYNFGIPSVLKAYFDHVARAGVTFRYTANGPEGFLKGKQTYVFAARGGRYAGTPADTQSAYLRDFLGFIGLDRVEFVYAEGLNLGEAQRRQGLADAEAAVDRLNSAARIAA